MKIGTIGKLVACFALSVIASTEAEAQSQPGSSDPPNTSRQAPSIVTIPMISRDESQDRQFLALVGARDRQYSGIGEIRRIISYHENLRTRLERAYDDVLQFLPRDQFAADVNRALTKLKKFEEEVKAEPDLSKKRALAEHFDQDFPLSVPDRMSTPTRSTFQRTDVISSRFSVTRERTTLSEVFQSISADNREWFTKYEKILKATEDSLSSLTTPRKTPLSDLPFSFDELAGHSSFETLTPEAIQLGIDKYRTALQAATSAYQPPSATTISEAKGSILNQADAINRELTQHFSGIQAQFREFEKSIAATAKSLYGNKVGADSFNYLLIVFAGVFAVIMLIPRLYKDSGIALNLLKAEFLLQFSTVFVLIAAIIILGIGELIDKQQLPVLLAGISGYVLGQLGKT